MAVRVMLVDDQAEVRVMLRTALRLRRLVEVVGEAATGETARLLAAETRPDVVVLDLQLPDIAGRDVFAGVRQASPESGIVIYTVRDSDRAWYERRGARYVSKDDEINSVVQAIENWPGYDTPN